MYFDEALTSTVSALEVASALDYLVQGGITDKHVEVIVRDIHGEVSSIWVRPLLSQDFIPTADNGQIIKCIADDGRRVDILLPPTQLRQDRHAFLAIGPAVQ